jgi:hypothetical protein
MQKHKHKVPKGYLNWLGPRLMKLAGTTPNEVEVTSLNPSLPPLVWTCKKKKKNTNKQHQQQKSFFLYKRVFYNKIKKKKWQMLLAAGEQDASS